MLYFVVPILIYSSLSHAIDSMVFDVLNSPNSLSEIQCSSLDQCTDLTQVVCNDIPLASSPLPSSVSASIERFTQSPRSPHAHMAMLREIESTAYSQTTYGQSNAQQDFNTSRDSILTSLNTSNISQQSKDLMTAKLSSISLLSLDEAISRESREIQKQEPGISKESALTSALMSVTQICGRTGMNANAVYRPSNYVLLCPGLLISASQENSGNAELVSQAVKDVLSHEIAHSIDGHDGELGTTYDQLQKCFTKNHPEINWASMKNELIADLWAQKSLVRSWKSRELSGNHIINELRNLKRTVCNSEESQDHPSREFRIGIMLGKNPEVLGLIGCGSTTVKKSSCDF